MYKTFGEYLKEMRKRSGKTLREVEKETRTSNAYLSQLENGTRIPTLLTLNDLATAYGVKFSELADIAHQFLNKKTVEKALSPTAKRISQDYDKLSSEEQAAVSQLVRSYIRDKK